MNRRWTLTIDAPARWLNANDRRHRLAAARDVREWRQAAGWHARAARLPRGLAAVHVLAVLRMPDRRRRDPANFHPTVKAVVDGLVDYGLIPDDNPTHLDGPDIRVGDPLPVSRPGAYRLPGRLVLTITEVA